MARGKVMWFNGKKGYGFIKTEDGNKDIFVHYSGIVSDSRPKMLNENDEVEFDMAENEKGNIAINVKKVA